MASRFLTRMDTSPNPLMRRADLFMAAPLPYTLIMTLELDQVPFGIQEVKHPGVHPTRCTCIDDLNAQLLDPFLFRLKIIERNAKGHMRKGSQLRVNLRRFIAREPTGQFLFEKRQVVIPCPDGIEDRLATALLVFSQNFKTDHLFVESSHPVKVVDRSEERRVGKECRSRWSPY